MHSCRQSEDEALGLNPHLPIVNIVHFYIKVNYRPFITKTNPGFLNSYWWPGNSKDIYELRGSDVFKKDLAKTLVIWWFRLFYMKLEAIFSEQIQSQSKKYSNDQWQLLGFPKLKIVYFLH